MILISVLLVLVGYMVNHRRKTMMDYPKPVFKPAAPVYLCDSCGVPHTFKSCGPHRFVNCVHSRDNVNLVGKCRFWVAVVHG